MKDQPPPALRINKYISSTGFCSRREADRLIAQGRVRLNGRTAVLGDQASRSDEVLVDGNPVKTDRKEDVLIAFHKPVGITCTTERDVEGNIIDYINHPERIFPIGRLDKPSEGLIFLTSDGDLVNKILRAGNRHEKEYEVAVDRPVSPDFIHKMGNGVSIMGTLTQKCRVRATGRHTFTIVLTQGLNRQIRRMCSALGYRVTRLKRVRIMHVKLGQLPPGKWRDLTPDERAEIDRLTAHSTKTEEASLFDGSE